jgi:general secretion pathway protein K
MKRLAIAYRKPTRQRGIVLLLVLWIVVLLTVLISSFVQSASTEGQQARFTLNTTQARYAAEAGLHRAIFELGNPSMQLRWKGDARPYEIEFDGAKVTIEIQDDSGKIDLNSADLNLLKAMFAQVGVEPRQVEALAAAVIDFRDPDELLTPNGAEKSEYLRADLPYGPRNQYFYSISELQQVLGMDLALFERVEPMVTINTGMQPNLAFAQEQTMMAVMAMQGQPATLEQVRGIIAARQALSGSQSLTLPNGGSLALGGGGSAFTIKVSAELTSGAKAVLQASVQLGSGTVGARPFRVSRWREGLSN